MRESYVVVFWSPENISSGDFCISFFEGFMRPFADVQCLNLSGRYDENTRRLMLASDLVVIGVRRLAAKSESVVKYLRDRSKRVMFMIIEYFQQIDSRISALRDVFRADEYSIVRIPYNVHRHNADYYGVNEKYITLKHPDNGYERMIDFRRELRRSAEMILMTLEKDER